MKSHTRNVRPMHISPALIAPIFTTKSIFRIFSVLLVVIFMLGQITPARAATTTVTSLLDDGGAGTLRTILTNSAPGDIVNFALGLSGQTITLTAELLLTKNVTIDASLLPVPITLSGQFVRVFNVNPGVTAIFESLRVTNSQVTGPGGGISNSGTLTVKNSTISGNSAVTATGNGGGIYNTSILTVTNSTISGNLSNGSGGGIYNAGLLTVTNSTFSTNTASGVGGGNGGGIYNSSSAIVANSTFSGNTANGSGGGGGLYNSVGTITVLNSTLSGNAASTWGGGINLNSGTLNYANTIVVNSTNFDCYKGSGNVGTDLNNLVKNNATGSFACGTPAYTVDPLLGSLANNGGPTQTMALGAGSPAINTGDNATCSAAPVSAKDQRGITRPQGGVNCDIGAYEAVVNTLTVDKTGSTGTGKVTSSPVGIDCGLTCSYAFNNGTAVTLTATPDLGSTFTGWTVTVGGIVAVGACPGTGTCQVVMDAAKTVTAKFTATYYMVISKAGTGTGTVTSSPAGINCGSTCQLPFIVNTVVTLTAVADAGSTFTGWSGEGCSGTGTCVVTMDFIKFVTANFTGSSGSTFTMNVLKAGTGAGTVTSSPAGITCGASCSSSFSSGTVVTLTAVADAGSSFTGWSGAGCSGTGTCVVTMSAVQSVTATFDIASSTYNLNIAKTGTGTGVVTSSPVGINCGATCSFTFNSGTVVTLTAVPDAGFPFGGWSGGGCSGTGTCVVTMSAAQSVIATFGTTTTFNLTVNKVGTGTGTVTSSPVGIACGVTCAFAFNSGTLVTLTAVPDAGFPFSGWSGAGCSGTGTCVVNMNAVQSVIATFGSPTTNTLSVSKVGTGTGVVTSSPVGIDCGTTCSFPFTIGAVVTLTAVPDAGIPFSGWSGGGCSGTGTCVVTMSTAQSVIAIFGTPMTFTDVSTTYWAYQYIERLYDAGITGGCSAAPLMYCPLAPVTRAQMAIFILRGIHGKAYVPPAATGKVFSDVVLSTFGAAWIEQFALEGVTSGCGSGKYCPDDNVTRAQMAIFLLKGKHSSAYVPPVAKGVFSDVPVGSFAADWIEQLAAEGITSGCGGGLYCPNSNVTRDQMAVFLVKAFSLP